MSSDTTAGRHLGVVHPLNDPDLLARAEQHITYVADLARHATEIDNDANRRLQAYSTGEDKALAAQQEVSTRYATALATVSMAHDLRAIRELLEQLRSGQSD